MTAGYSGTPLARKLSLKDGMRVWWDGMPDCVREEIAGEGLQFTLLYTPELSIDAIRVAAMKIRRRDIITTKPRTTGGAPPAEGANTASSTRPTTDPSTSSSGSLVRREMKTSGAATK